MDEIKRGFLRACINSGVLEIEPATRILEPICNKYEINVPELATLVSEINKEITQFDQTLTIQKYSFNNKEYVIYANTHGLPNTVHPTLNDEERRYFAILMEALSNADEYSIKWHEAYALVNDPGTKAVPLKRKRDLIEQWKMQGYLHDHDDYLTFGPRMLIEFDFHFRSHYPEQFKACPLCKKLTYWDIECSKCHIKIHRDCLRSYLRLQSVCPECKIPWETPLL